MSLALVQNAPALTAIIDRANLICALTNACQVASKPKNGSEQTEITEFVILRRSGIGLSVTATDFDIVSTTFVSADVPEGFLTALPARQLLDCLKKANASREVNITPYEFGAELQIGPATFNLKCRFRKEDFPLELAFQEQLVDSKLNFIVERKTFLPMLKRCAPAMSKEQTRYYLMGVLFAIQNNQLIMVSTDGHRLVRFVGNVPAGAGDMPDTIVPAPVVHELHRILKQKNAPEEIMVTVADSAISFLIGENELIECKAVDGTYPDFNRVIPKAPDQIVSFDPYQMATTMTAVSGLDASKRAIALAIHEQGIDVSLGKLETADSYSRLEADLAGVEPITLGVNRLFLKEMLDTFDGRARMGADNNTGPIWFGDTADPRFTYVIMPLRV